MLWQKDRNTELFVDILKNIEYPQQIRLIHRRKNNSFAVKLRTDAWNYYNESICFAERDSVDLSYGYANRSLSFFKLQLYERSLRDIRLAKEANYPERLMAKLSDRESQCVKRLDSSVQEKCIQPTLSFPPSESFPGMANVLQCHSTEMFGRSITARCNIVVGATVIIEEGYIYIIDCDLNIFCTSCGEAKMNLVACENCADATFCSIDCAENDFHQFECEMTIGADDNCDGISLTFLLRSIVIATTSFESTKQMMEHVEHWLLTANSREVIESDNSAKSKYKHFFNLASVVSDERILKARKIVFYAFHSIMSSPKLSCKFQTTAEKRFLVHLIMHHDFIIRTNSFESETCESRVQELGLLTSYFNHSCLPNVTKLCKGNLSICKTISPIKKGDQLFVTYIAGETFDMTSRQRNETLKELYGFNCKCQLCTLGRLDGGDLDKDPSFLYVSTNILDDSFVILNVKTMIEKCKKFLLKYECMTRSKEVAYISEMLSALFAKELKM